MQNTWCLDADWHVKCRFWSFHSLYFVIESQVGNSEVKDSKNSRVKLSHDRVKQIVTARVPGSNVSDVKEFRGEGDSFKGKLVHGGVTYDFEIDAYTGRAIKWSSNK